MTSPTRQGRAKPIVAICAFKGGVGKTTTVANLGLELGKRHRVLLVDLDPQGNLLGALDGLDTEKGPATSSSLLADSADGQGELSGLTKVTYEGGGVDLLPAGPELTQLEEKLTISTGGERALTRLLTGHSYDLVLIDTRPSDGRLTLNGVCASTSVLGVVNPARWSAEGVGKIQRFTKRSNDLGISNTVYAGTLVTKVESGKRILRDQVLEDLGTADISMIEPFVPLRTAAGESEYLGIPVVVSEPGNPVAKAYKEIASLISGSIPVHEAVTA